MKTLYRIYAMIDPRDHAVRYVGVTSRKFKVRLANAYAEYLDAPGRVAEHLRRKNGQPLLHEWACKLKRDGYTPIMKQVEIVSRLQAFERETYWINYYASRGSNLLNIKKVYSTKS